MQRTVLTAPETFTPSPTYPTQQALWDYVMANYDLAGQPITFTGFTSPSNPATTGLLARGMFVGQTDYSQVTILGDPTTPTNAQIITNGEDPFHFMGGAAVWLRGFYLMATDPINGLLTLDNRSTVIIGKAGDPGLMIFGPILTGQKQSFNMNDMSIAGGSQVGILDSVPTGPGSVISCNLGGDAGKVQKQCMVDIAQGSTFSVNTNGTPGLLDWVMEGNNSYAASVFRGDLGSTILLGNDFTGDTTHGQQYWMNGYSAGVDYNPPHGLPGDQPGNANAPYGQWRNT